jgi:hypothetical protein
MPSNFFDKEEEEDNNDITLTNTFVMQKNEYPGQLKSSQRGDDNAGLPFNSYPPSLPGTGLGPPPKTPFQVVGKRGNPQRGEDLNKREQKKQKQEPPPPELYIPIHGEAVKLFFTAEDFTEMRKTAKTAPVTKANLKTFLEGSDKMRKHLLGPASNYVPMNGRLMFTEDLDSAKQEYAEIRQIMQAVIRKQTQDEASIGLRKMIENMLKSSLPPGEKPEKEDKGKAAENAARNPE